MSNDMWDPIGGLDALMAIQLRPMMVWGIDLQWRKDVRKHFEGSKLCPSLRFMLVHVEETPWDSSFGGYAFR